MANTLQNFVFPENFNKDNAFTEKAFLNMKEKFQSIVDDPTGFSKEMGLKLKRTEAEEELPAEARKALKSKIKENYNFRNFAIKTAKNWLRQFGSLPFSEIDPEKVLDFDAVNQPPEVEETKPIPVQRRKIPNLGIKLDADIVDYPSSHKEPKKAVKSYVIKKKKENVFLADKSYQKGGFLYSFYKLAQRNIGTPNLEAIPELWEDAMHVLSCMFSRYYKNENRAIAYYSKWQAYQLFPLQSSGNIDDMREHLWRIEALWLECQAFCNSDKATFIEINIANCHESKGAKALEARKRCLENVSKERRGVTAEQESVSLTAKVTSIAMGSQKEKPTTDQPDVIPKGMSKREALRLGVSI